MHLHCYILNSATTLSYNNYDTGATTRHVARERPRQMSTTGVLVWRNNLSVRRADETEQKTFTINNVVLATISYRRSWRICAPYMYQENRRGLLVEDHFPLFTQGSVSTSTY